MTAPYYFGDSIADGLRAADNGEGDTLKGRSTTKVLEAIRNNKANLRGRPIVLSTGLSNSPADTAVIQQQIAELKAQGVNPADIRIVGLGKKFSALNPGLETIAHQNGATFTGGFQSGKDDVHPASYTSLLKTLNLGANQTTTAQPDTSPVVTPPVSAPLMAASDATRPTLPTIGGQTVPIVDKAVTGAMTPEDAKSYLSGLSMNRNRAGDTSFMHPDFAVKLATAIKQARAEGIPAALLSGYREPSVIGSAYDEGHYSGHEYGVASDISGIGLPGSKSAQRWAQIAKDAGLFSPYDPAGREYNHWQAYSQPNFSDQQVSLLQAAKKTGDPQKMWSAFNGINSQTPPTTATTSTPVNTGAGPTVAAAAAMPDNRQAFFHMLTTQAGLSPQQALGVLWGIGGESTPLINTGSVNPKDPQGGAFGALQWVGPRRWPLEEIAKRRGVSATDIQLQTDYALGELTGNTDNVQGAQFQPGVLDALKAAKTPEEATRIWVTRMERPAVDNSAARIAQGGAVGSLDAQNLFVPGMGAKRASTPGPPPAAGADTKAPVTAPAGGSPWASLGSILGQAFAGLAGGGGGGGGGTVLDPPDPPAIRSAALQTDFLAPHAGPVPANLASGAGSPLGQQLGLLAASPGAPPLIDPNAAPSITAGAPSMTSMLGDVGYTGSIQDMLDPNKGGANLMNPYARTRRLS